MIAEQLNKDVYLELLHECFEAVEDSKVGGISELAEWEIEKECGEAVSEVEHIGDPENPSLNAKVIALSIYSEDAIKQLDENPMLTSYDDISHVIASVATRTMKQDVLHQVLDERANIKRRREDDGAGNE